MPQPRKASSARPVRPGSYCGETCASSPTHFDVAEQCLRSVTALQEPSSFWCRRSQRRPSRMAAEEASAGGVSALAGGCDSLARDVAVGWLELSLAQEPTSRPSTATLAPRRDVASPRTKSRMPMPLEPQ